jgi:HAD superfamily hydrolase (TIGR01484 family)
MRLLICTDLDRTLLPNGAEPESPDARAWFHRGVALPEVTLAYVTGRDEKLVRQAIEEYKLPLPDFVVGDVGSSIYMCRQGVWQASSEWQAHIASDWGSYSHSDLAVLLDGFKELELQEVSRQNTYKLSYYTPILSNHKDLVSILQKKLLYSNINASLNWSIDERANRGLLDILPACATKRHAIEFLMGKLEYSYDNTVFSGDSGNDLPVLVSAIPSILVRNASSDIKQEAEKMTKSTNTEKSLYLAQGGFKEMNGNYAAGILEGLAHYHPELTALLEF